MGPKAQGNVQLHGAKLDEQKVIPGAAVNNPLAGLLGDRDELRAIYAQERYSLSGDELDDILAVVKQYA